MVRKTVMVFAVLCLMPSFCALPDTASAVAGDKELCVQLKWFHQAQFAGFYVAREKGFYREKGLAVKFIEGGPSIDWPERMADRSCPVGIATAHDLIIARERGVPVVAVAAVDQVSPIVFFSLAQRNIHSPREFPGRSIALLQNAVLQFYGVLKRVGVDLATVKRMPFSVDLARLYGGEVDIWSGYYTNLVSLAQEDGHQVNVIFPLDYGVQVYDDVIYVHEELISADTGTVEGFLRASFKGWLETIKDPAAAVDFTLTYAPRSTRSHEELLLKRTIPYVHTGEVPIGWMEPDIWTYIAALTHEVGLVETGVDPESVYTTKFLKEIYGGTQ